MDLVQVPHNVELIKKMMKDGVPETMDKYGKLLKSIRDAFYQKTQAPPATQILTKAVKDLLDKTKEEPSQIASPRAQSASGISLAPSFPALVKEEIAAAAKKAADEKGDSGKKENVSSVDNNH